MLLRVLILVTAMPLKCCECLRRENENFAVQPHPIQFNEEPEDWTVSVGSSVSLTCNTSVVQIVGYLDEERTPSPQIEWIHNNVTISSGGHYTINNSTMGTSILTITDVTLVQQGDYHCLVNDWKKEDGGWWTSTRSRSGHITVMDPSNTSAIVNEQQNVILSCVALAMENADIVWMRNGLEMTKPLTDGDGNLLLFGVSEDDIGHYQCNSSVGEVSVGYYLNVEGYYSSGQLEIPKLLLNMDYVDNQFVRIKSNQFGCPTEVDNQSVSLHCNATGYQEMIWYKNGQLLDVNSTDIVFNQTTSSWTITKNNPCDLLGVYQCFVSNEVGTVHVSTRVLPLGWPNHPGRPELLAHSSFSNGFKLVIKLHPPDYMGGLPDNRTRYDLYVDDSSSPESNGNFYGSTLLPNLLVNVTLDNLQLNGGPGGLVNTYHVFTQLTYSKVENSNHKSNILNAFWEDIVALPTGSPYLTLRTFCELIDYPPPIVEETCHYNDTGDFVTHNVSWRVEGSVLNYVFAANIALWLLSGGCHYPNGSVAAITGPLTFRNYWSRQLPVNTTCNISISYSIVCPSKPYPTSFNVPCKYTTNDPTVQVITNSTSSDSNPTVIFLSSSAGLMVLFLTAITIIALVCYWKYLHSEPSDVKLLKSANTMKELQLNSPVSIGQQSVILSDMKSDIYLEKVGRWMDQMYDNDQCSICDTVSVDAAEMLNQILQEKNIDQPYFSMSQCVTNKPSISTQELSSPTSITSISDAFLSPKSSSSSRKQPTNIKQKKRLISADSGVDVGCLEHDTTRKHGGVVVGADSQHCHPLLKVAEHQNKPVDEGDPQQIVKYSIDVKKVDYDKWQTSDSSISNVLLQENSDCSFDQGSSGSQKSVAGMSHYFDPETMEKGEEFPYTLHSGSCTIQQFADPSNQAIVVGDGSKDSEMEYSKSTDGIKHTSDVKCSSETDEIKVTVGDYTSGDDFDHKIVHTSTQETGQYIGFDGVNKTTTIPESGFNNEFQLTVEHGTKKEHDDVAMGGSIQHCQPLLEIAENTSVHEGEPHQIVKNRKVEYHEWQTSGSKVGTSSTISNDLLLENSDCKDSGCSQKSIAGMPHYFDPETREKPEEFPYILHSESDTKQQFDDPSNQVIVVEDGSKDSKVESSQSTDGVKQQADGYFGFEVMYSMHSNASERDVTVTVGDYTSAETSGDNFVNKFRHKSTCETEKYIDLNQTRDAIESGFNDKFQVTVQIDKYVESSSFDNSKEKFKDDSDQSLSLSDKLRDFVDNDVVDLRSTEAVGDYIRQEYGDVEKSGDLSRHESSEWCHHMKHCDSVDIEHPRSPDPAIVYTFNSDGYIVDHD